jgi:hypothetical protein
MRYRSGLLILLLSCAVTASAQNVSAPPIPPKEPARMSPDDVVARLMQFDRNNDFKIGIDELPERMQTLVVRGDKSDDLMLDAREIRRMTTVGPDMPVLFNSPQFGSYGFGDIFGLSSRTHIENSIDDLRLAPQAAAEAKRIALAQVDEYERTAKAGTEHRLTDERRAALVDRLSGVLTDEERDNLNAALARRPLVKGPDVTALVETLKAAAQERTITPVVP